MIQVWSKSNYRILLNFKKCYRWIEQHSKIGAINKNPHINPHSVLDFEITQGETERVRWGYREWRRYFDPKSDGAKGWGVLLRLLQSEMGFSLSLFKICFYALIKLNYFSLLIHSLLELGKTKQKKGLGITVFFPFINSFTTNPLWVVKTRLQIMNNILLYFDFLLRISFSSPHYHRYTPQQPDPPFSGEFSGDRS